jgi:hypothetical protein
VKPGRSHQEKNICRQKVSENRVLRRIFGPELRTGGRRQVHKEKLYELYPKPNTM